ncbi:MAG: aminotransferase class III-fold pyridoxal phosphate-dependent enzyme [Gemmatimonadetes bacterium]|nr:aminotransferase class III-fold pyridoxal phosphate-dependent enzyme [Gemmatimonadota bacterium]
MTARLHPALPVRLTRSGALAAFGLDVAYTRGDANRLFHGDDDETAVWDFLGGYGATFFGHNHPALTAAMLEFLNRGGVVHGQASIRSRSDALRSALVSRLRDGTGRDYELVFGSTGAEAIEIAVKHAAMTYAVRSSAALQTLTPAPAPAAASAPAWTAAACTTLKRLRLWRGTGKDALAQIAEHNARVLEAEPAFIAVRRAFHGMTNHALSLTDDAERRFGHRSAGDRFRFVDGSAAGELEELLSQLTHVLVRVEQRPGGWTAEAFEWTAAAAFFMEPIQGEGGIHPVAAETARAWQAACAAHDVPLVADEIQSGMGRTGSFLFSDQLGIAPDYVLLGKSLGGGLAKISAVAIAREQWLDTFALQHSSTFAEDDLSAEVALRALDLLDGEDGPRRAREAGGRLLTQLAALTARYPDLIREVRGCGLMLGLEWRSQPFDRSPALRFLQRYGWLGYAYSGYLLRQHGIRVAPALSMGLTLRIEPAYSIPDDATRQLLGALDRLCRLVRAQDAGGILGPCIGANAAHGAVSQRTGAQANVAQRSTPQPAAPLAPRMICRPPLAGAHIGFVGHFIDADSVALWDPALGRLGGRACDNFLDHVLPFAEPLVCHRDHVHSVTGAATSVTFVGIPVSSQQCYAAMRSPARRELRQLVQRAVDMAADEGCTVAGLGGYCSILTRNGRDLRNARMAITTGNSHTVAVGLAALSAAAASEGINMATAHAAVLGATGNIGSVLAELLSREVASIVLIGRPARRRELEILGARIVAHARTHGRSIRVRVSSDPAECRDAQVVATASNSPDPVLYPEHFGAGPVAVLDLAVPGDVHASVTAGSSRVRVIRGGVVRTPLNDDWYVPGIPLARGAMFACMAEAVLMGLEGRHDGSSLGALSPADVLHMAALSRRHGFSIAQVDAAPMRHRDLVYSR